MQKHIVIRLIIDPPTDTENYHHIMFHNCEYCQCAYPHADWKTEVAYARKYQEQRLDKAISWKALLSGELFIFINIPQTTGC